MEGPQNWGPTYMKAAQDEFSDASTLALARARALAYAPPEVNPWLTSFAEGLSGLASMGGGGGGKGGGGSGFGGFF